MPRKRPISPVSGIETSVIEEGAILPGTEALAALSARIAGAPDVAALAACTGGAHALAMDLREVGAGARLVTQTLSRLNDAIVARVLDLLRRRHRLPPTRWCWLGLGSEGRLEQTLATDQDNGLVFSASDDGEASRLRELFLPFAAAVNQALAECGFPLCDGHVMAGNPRWCLSLSEWDRNFSAWVRSPDPQALLNAAIFFDFRPIVGDAELAATMRQGVSALTRGSEVFLRMMTVNALAAEPPLGRLRDFAVAVGSGGIIDLKKFGTRIIVDAARILALAAGTDETATVGRLRAVTAAGLMTPLDAEAAGRAFDALQDIRLAVQAGRQRDGHQPGNAVDPGSLNDFDRHVLLEALRQARALQRVLRARFHIDA